MSAYAERASRYFFLGEDRTSFTREQVAFLEDLLINQGCMRALEHGRGSREPEKCRECALHFAQIVDTIREMRQR